MNRYDRPLNFWLWLLTFSAVTCLPVQAQVVPDATLGAGKNSVTTTQGDRTDITGGLRRSSALFHSFDRFSIDTNRQVYFANPTGIRNIFSRVTGSSVSNIDGLLGVSGSANLFLMNPNGIIFGPNARLDVAGSFLATTANVLEFADGQRFAADGDRSVPLVEVNIPIGLQMGANAPAMLANQGNLTAGQDLTLTAGNLDLQGQLQAGGNLTLNATDTVRIRDTVTEPFVARSGGEMKIQGDRGIDILTLSHLSQMPFVSGGDLAIVSDGRISGDAHFASGGSFVIKSISGQSANFVSLYDPIISSAGSIDVAGTYNGQALLVESLGNIRFQGSINITGNDPAFAGNPNPDLAILGGSAALIVRANRTALAFAPNVPPTTVLNGATFQAGAVPAGITIGGDISTDGGTVILSATGRIQIGGTVPLLANSILARTVTIDTPSTVQIAGGINARQTTPGTAGNIRIGTITQPSAVTVGIISARNSSTGNGGDVTINTTGNLTTTGAFGLDGSSYITPGTINPAIIVSIASQAETGRSGDITITAGGVVNLAAGISSASNFDGKGGSTSITGGSIDTTRGVVTSSNNGVVIGSGGGFVANPGTGGDVRLTATSGDLRIGSINSSSNNSNSSNSYSVINLTADAGSVLIDQANLSTSNLGTYYAGDIRITAANRLEITGNSALRSDGYFGVIDLRTTGTNPAGRILIRDSTVTAAIPAATAIATTAQPDSRIDINAAQVTIDNSRISTEVATQTRQANSGNISVQGETLQILRNSRLETTVNLEVTGDSGNISVGSIAGTTSVNLENSRFLTTANGFGNSGTIAIAANQAIAITGVGTGSILRTTTGPANTNGIAGSVIVTSNAANGQAIQVTNTSINAAASGIDGRTGGVTLQATEGGNITLAGTESSPAQIFTETRGSQPTQDINIIAGDVTTRGGNITINNYKLDATVVSGSGAGGDILVQSNGGSINLVGNNSLSNQAGIETNVNPTATGSGGNIAIESNGGAVEFSNGFQVNSATNTTNPLAASGKGGEVSITSNGGQITLGGGSTIDARTTGSQAGGNVEIRSGTGQISVLNNSTINASTSGSRTGGNVSLTSEGSPLNLGSGSIATTVESSATGNGGTIALNSNGGAVTLGDATANTAFTINAQTQATNLSGTSQENGRGGNVTLNSSGGAIAVINNASINASTTGTKDGGTTQISSQGGSVLLDRGSVLTTVGASGSGNGGTVTINSGSGTTTLRNQATVNASTDGSGNAGTVNLDGANLRLENSTLLSESRNPTSSAASGNITLSGLTTLQLDNSRISASTVNGVAARLFVNADGTPLSTIALNNSELSLAATGNGSAGDIRLNTQQLTLQNNSAISAEAAGTGSAGSVRVDANGFPTDTISLTEGSSLLTRATGSGNAGSIALVARQLTLTDGSQISGSTAGGRGENINLTGLNRLQVTNSLISASTTGNSGQAGNVTVDATDSVTLSGTFNGASGGISTQAATGNGSAGQVALSTPQLIVQNGAAIVADTDSGRGSGITLNNLNTLRLDNGTISATTANGEAGDLFINAGRSPASSVTLNNSRLEVEATGSGRAGSISLAAQQVTLQQSSSIRASTNTGVGENITLSGLNTLQLDNSTIAASTVNGVAGNLFVNDGGAPASSISLSNQSVLSLAATGTGSAGSTVLNTRQLTLQDSTIKATTLSGRGRDIVVSGLDRLQLDHSTIAASTETGVAGTLTITATGRVDLNNDSRLSVGATEQGGGTAGDLRLNAGRVRVNQSEITVSSRNGPAGNLTITTPDLRLDRGTLSAETGGSGTGANIRLEGLEALLLLRHGSLISANAGAQANGGNITILSPSFVIAQPFENSDIVANAVRGSGGEITITTNAIFGLAFRPKLTPRSDITASSEFGTSGTVALNTLNLDPSRGLTQLPTDLVDRTSQIAQGCSVGGSSVEKESRFTIAGRGGVQLSPTALLPAQATTSDWVSLDTPTVTSSPFPDGSLVALKPGHTYQIQTVCVNSWKNQQRSSLQPPLFFL